MRDAAKEIHRAAALASGCLGGEHPRVASIEAVILIGGLSNNTLNASLATVPVTLLGGLGNDTLIGGSQADVLIGGHRADSTAGTDSLTGGLGSDTFDNDPADTRVTAVGDTVLADVFATLPSWIDAV